MEDTGVHVGLTDVQQKTVFNRYTPDTLRDAQAFI